MPGVGGATRGKGGQLLLPGGRGPAGFRSLAQNPWLQLGIRAGPASVEALDFEPGSAARVDLGPSPWYSGRGVSPCPWAAAPTSVLGGGGVGLGGVLFQCQMGSICRGRSGLGAVSLDLRGRYSVFWLKPDGGLVSPVVLRFSKA